MRILGTGSAQPARRVTNEELTAFLDTSDEWIRTRTGIAERRVLNEESVLSLAREASLRALENTSSPPFQSTESSRAMETRTT